MPFRYRSRASHATGSKRKMVANIVALGAISELSSIVSKKAIEAAVLARVPKGTEKLNRDALKAGMAAAKRIEKEWALTGRRHVGK